MQRVPATGGNPTVLSRPDSALGGTRIAVYSADQENDIWIWDLGRQTLTRLTFDPATDQIPVWTPDGRRVIFFSGRAGVGNLWWQAADGSGTAERLTTSGNIQVPGSVSPDGTELVFSETMPTTGRDLMRVPLAGAHRVTPLLQTPFEERNGTVAPDGRWLAYESDSSGRVEIYVRPFRAGIEGQWQISTSGGAQPLWARSGTELF